MATQGADRHDPARPARWLEESPDALVVTDVDGAVRFWNRGAEVMFGYVRSEVLGRLLTSLIQPAHPDGDEPPAALTPDSRELARETVCQRRDGALIAVSVSARRLCDEAGRAEGVIHHHVDITHLKVQRDARLVEARHGQLLESTPDAIVIINDIGRVVLANGQAEVMFGYDRRELLGQPLEVLLPERFRAAHATHRARYLARSRIRPMGAGLELHGLRHGGDEFPVEISLSPLEIDGLHLVCSSIRDISERRRVEHALYEKNVELERASRAKDRFLATMSHELRTPLNAIIGFTGLLLMKLAGPLTADQEKQLKMVQHSGKHLLSLINDLLDLAKIDSGRVDMELQPMACQPVIEDVATTLAPTAAEKGLRLDVDMPDEPVIVRADRRALQQILLNLTANAIKFTAAGQVVIVVSRIGAPGARQVCIAVRDSGVGISADDQARLFEAFVQVGSLTAGARTEGTGLGLHLSRKLADLLGGRIELASAPGRGSTFTLVLDEHVESR